MAALITRALRRVGQRLLPSPAPDLMTTMIRNDARSDTYFRAIEYIDFEGVPGDIVECGVFGGLSLAMFAQGLTFHPTSSARRVVGIDSFEGLPASVEDHARWREGDCAVVHGWHPLAREGERVSPATVRQLFAHCGLRQPDILEGRFADVLPRVVPETLGSVALLHVDCDLYESTRDALEGLAPVIEDGAVVMFDDWFHFKGRPDRGEARALGEFLDRHPEWQAVPWRVYGTFCQAFIFVRR
jgi:predicted O-methyltransferase YrrM